MVYQQPVKKNIALLLSGFLTISFSVSGCAGSDSAETTASSDTINSETVNETTAEEDTTAELSYVVPAIKNYDGYEFRILADLYSNASNVPYYYTEKLNGELINDTIFNRNAKIEEEYNVKISFTQNDNVMSLLKKGVSAGDDICDVAFGGWNSQMFEIAETGILLNYYNITSINLSDPWWDQRIQEGYTVNGKLYGMTGDIAMEDDLNQLAVLYNTFLAQQYGIDDLVQTVLDGGWTLDYMKELVKSVTSDTNGDGLLDDGDLWGLTTESLAGWYFLVGSGESTISNDNGNLSLNLTSERLFNVVDKTIALLADKSITLCTDDGMLKDDIWNTTMNMFINDQVLFRTGTFGDSTQFRDMESDFGVLPIPKYDEIQNEYYCMSHNVAKPAMLPTTIADSARAGSILDAMSYESMLTLSPAFYETYLGDKIMREENSKKMLELLFSSKIYDLDFTLGLTGLPKKIYSIIKGGSNNFSSDAAAATEKSEAALKKFTDYFA